VISIVLHRWTCPPSARASEIPTRSAASGHKTYLRKVDAQLNSIEARIGDLHTKWRSLKGPEKERLAINIDMLRGKLREARGQRKRMETTSDEWLQRKKVLDAKLIRLQKSLTYVLNSRGA